MIRRFLSWNVNGVRAAEKKGFLEWLRKEKPDFLGIQEAKACREQLPPHLREPEGYRAYWNCAERKGYSGVASFIRGEALSSSLTIGRKEFDREGRVIALEMEPFVVLNIYFPNGRSGQERLDFKLDFYEYVLGYMSRLKKDTKKPLILCGDLNTAHAEIDLARPKENRLVSGFMDAERAWIDALISWGMVDTFRAFNSGPGHYTWWDLKSRARERNVGWRLDYFFVDKEIRGCLREAFILDHVMGSDHCPVGMVLDI